MERFFKEWKGEHLTAAVLCILFGVVLVVWPDLSLRVVCVGLGVVLLLSGIVHLAGFWAEREAGFLSRFNLLAGIVLAVVGIWIVWKPELLIMAVPVVIGVIVTLHGIHNVSQAVSLKRDGYERWWVALLLGIVTVLFGALLIFYPFGAAGAAVILMGVLLIYDGATDLWILSRISRTVKDAHRTDGFSGW